MTSFEETRSGKDGVYWFEYVDKFGTTHLNNPTHRLSYVAIYDLDIKLIIGSFVLTIVQVIVFAIKS